MKGHTLDLSQAQGRDDWKMKKKNVNMNSKGVLIKTAEDKIDVASK